jgi:hypothetical protein
MSISSLIVDGRDREYLLYPNYPPIAVLALGACDCSGKKHLLPLQRVIHDSLCLERR